MPHRRLRGRHLHRHRPGDDCVEKYVADPRRASPQLFPPGELFSYNNAGFCVLGRIVEVLREQAVRRLPARAPVRPARADPRGHRPVRGDPVPGRDRATSSRARRRPAARADLGPGPLQRAGRRHARDAAARPARLRAMHLDGGTAADGTLVLAPGSVDAMRERQVELPYARPDGRRLGPRLGDLRLARRSGDRSRRRHHRPGRVPADGPRARRRGRAAHQRRQPDRRSTPTSSATCCGELAGVEMPALPVPPAEPAHVDAERYVGTYALGDRRADRDPGRRRPGLAGAEPRRACWPSSAGSPSARSWSRLAATR